MAKASTKNRPTSKKAKSGPSKKGKAATKKGLSVKTFKGLSKKRMASKASENFGKRVRLDKGSTVPVQFLELPNDFIEYEMHAFQENGRWTYVPCIGEDCPLCQSESDQIRKTSYRFSCNVWNLKEKKVQILEGPKDLAQRIFYRYERAPKKFLKRTYEITKFPTNPVSYGMDIGEDEIKSTAKLMDKLHDLDAYVDEEARRYYGDEVPSAKALDADEEDVEEDEDLDDEDEDDEEEDEDLDDDDEDDEDEDDDDEEEDEDDDDEEDDEDDDDEDEEDDDDEDEDEDEDDEDDEDDDDDDEPVAPAKKKAAKKPAAKKAAAKKAVKKAPAKKAAKSKKKS